MLKHLQSKQGKRTSAFQASKNQDPSNLTLSILLSLNRVQMHLTLSSLLQNSPV